MLPLSQTVGGRLQYTRVLLFSIEAGLRWTDLTYFLHYVV